MTGDKVEKESMAYGHLSDLEMAGKVRMLMRNDLEHEGVCVGARDRIMYLSQQVDRLSCLCAEYLANEGEVPDWLTRAAEDIHANKLRHGWKVTTSEAWEDLHEIPAVLMLIVSEVSEALEAFRRKDRANFEEELADASIRIIGLAHGMDIDLKTAILAKIEKNKTREHRHGGKRI